MWINFHGLFQSPMSWAQVNREMVLALHRLGCKIAVMAYRGFCFDPEFPLPDPIPALRKIPRSPHFDVALEYPLNYKRFQARHKIGLLVYKTTELPPHWIEAIIKYLDLLVVPSRFCRQVALKSGVDKDRVALIPYGFNPRLFSPSASLTPTQKDPEKKFTFFCVAMPHIRKGVTELIQAFTEEFGPREPVQLVLKLPYLPATGSSKKPWEIKSLEGLQRQNSPEKPNIHIIVCSEPVDQMPLWFALCDAYIQPSYSEGFGLSILEAKALGKPTIVTGWGGHMDFCREENSYLIDYELIPAAEAQYDNCSPSALCAKPVISSLRRHMREIFQHPEKAKQKARLAIQDIQDLTWDGAAARFMTILRERMVP